MKAQPPASRALNRHRRGAALNTARLAGLLLLAGCASREAGIEVQVDVTVGALSAAHVSLARLSLTGVRGVPCSELMATRWSPVSAAWAHGGHSTTASPLAASFSVPLDLTTPGATALATLRPPPGLWCALELTAAPSDSGEAWGGTTLLIDAQQHGVARRYLATSTRARQLAFVPHDLSFSRRRHHARLQLDASPVLSSLEPAAPDARRDLLDSLLASMSVSLESE